MIVEQKRLTVVTSALSQFAQFMDNVLGGIKKFDDVPEEILCKKEKWQLMTEVSLLLLSSFY